MTEKKITKKEIFGAMFTGITEGQKFEISRENETIEVTAEEMKNFITHEIELLNRKKSSGTKSKASKENQAIADFVLEFFKENPDRLMTCTELMKLVPTNLVEKEMSLPKMSSVMSFICGTVKEPLPNAPIIRVRDKRSTVFKYVG